MQTYERVHQKMGLMFVGLAMGLMLSVPQTALAGTPPPAAQMGVDKLCVVGGVIAHDEQPLGEGWEISATPYDDTGNPDEAKVITTTTDANGLFGFSELQPGAWQISINLKSQEGEWEGVTSDKFDIEVVYGAQVCQVVRFKLRRIVIVEVLKVDDFYNPLEGWTMIATPAPKNFFATKQIAVTENNGIATFRLTPGEWVFGEQAPAGVRYTPVIPLKPLLVNVQPPGPISLFFKNRIETTGCIEVVKYDISSTENKKAFALPGWHIEVRRADGTVAATGNTDAFGKVQFCGLPLGPYLVVEEKRLGWRPTTSSQVLVNLVDGSEAELVEFYNTQEPPGYIIIGYKIDTNGKIGLPDWKITATPVKPTDFAPNPVVTDGTGRYEFVFPDNDYRVPGAKYIVCEENRSGWLPHTKTCQTVTLPLKPGAPVQATPFENQQVGHQESQSGGQTCRITHVIQKWQTWLRVARLYKTRVGWLMRANPSIHARNSLNRYVGQSLCVP